MKFFAFQQLIKFQLSISILLVSLCCWSQDTTQVNDKTLSPYFFVKSTDGEVDQLPLKETTADVKISGVIADVTVKQTYCNIGEKPLEAIYVFPASTKAAVYYMQMELGGRIIKAEIMESDQAREEYEEAKEEGKTTSLLEQKRPNVFQMNVANILPDDTIIVEMRYTELITPLEGVYEFVYPTVVGPRYAEISSEEDSSWIEIPYTHEGEPPMYDFDINVKINAGMELQEVTSPSHAALQYSFPNEKSVECSLPEEEKKSGNKDFVLRYVLSGEALESGVLLYEGEEENFFLTMIQPPKSPVASDIPPREYVFIMDVSGSMSGFPIGVSKTLLNDLISGLRLTDKFNVMFFAGGSQVLADASLDATQENIDLAIDMINNKQGGGGTNMLSALEKALALPGTGNYSRTFVIVTDGYVSVETNIFDLIRSKMSEANFFAFGIGSGVNRHLIEGIARVGMGEPFVVLNEDEASDNADKFRKYIETPVLTNISINYEGFDVYDVEPLTVPDVFAERPIMTFGKYNDQANGSIGITGLSGSHTFNEQLFLSNYTPSEENAALKYLWARYVIQQLDDYGNISYDASEEAQKDTIVKLGLKYNLLTRYTSFIAIDSMIRNNGDSVYTVTQPVPLPEGVSDNALGFGGGTTTAAAQSYANYYGEEKAEETNRSYIKSVYPNPVKEKFEVLVHCQELDGFVNAELCIFDMQGQVLKTIDLNDRLKSGVEYIKLEVGLSEMGLLSSGVYRIALLIDGKSVSSKNVIVMN